MTRHTMVMAIRVNVQGVRADRQFVAMRMPIATKAAPVQKPFQNWRLCSSISVAVRKRCLADIRRCAVHRPLRGLQVVIPELSDLV